MSKRLNCTSGINELLLLSIHLPLKNMYLILTYRSFSTRGPFRPGSNDLLQTFSKCLQIDSYSLNQCFCYSRPGL